MRAFQLVAVAGLLGLSLSGCVAAEVVGAGVDVATTVVSTASDAVTGEDDKSSDDDKDKDKDKDK